MAIVLMVQQAIVMFSDIGLNAFVIRHKDYNNQTMLDTVWTIQLIRGWIMFLILLISCAVLFLLQQSTITTNWGGLNNHQLPGLIAVTSVIAIFNGYKSLAHLVYGRELNRSRIEVAQVISQLLGTITMIFWAWYAPSVWALASASLVSAIFSLFLSYKLFNIRHKFHWDKNIVRDVYDFGKWIVIATALTYLSQQGDRLFLSVNTSEAQLGLYSIAIILSSFAINIINKLTDLLWLPVFSSKSTDLLILKKAYYRLRFIQDVGLGVFVLVTVILTPYFIDLIYDERYTDVTWMLRLMIILVVPLSITSTAQALLVAVGETKVQMQVMFVKVLSLIIVLPWLFSLYQLKGVIMGTVISTFISIIPQYIVMKQRSILSSLSELKVVPLIIVLYVALIFRDL